MLNRLKQIRVPMFCACMIVLAGLSPGCAMYSHERGFAVPGSTERVGIETTKFKSFLMMGNASKVRTLVKDGGTNGYSRSVNIGAINGQGDVEMIRAVVESAVDSAVRTHGSSMP